MALKLATIKVETKDVDLMMKECLILYLKHHPDHEQFKISQRYMFKKLVEFYLTA